MAQARAVTLTPEFDRAIANTNDKIQAMVVAFAKREHAKVMAASPRPYYFKRTVDGVLGAREEAVKFNGLIVYDYPRIPLVVEYAMQMLFARSPVDSGDYRNSHTIFLNGEPVSNLARYQSGDDVAITNLVPYARKIELGKMKMRVAGTDHVYEQAESLVRRRYGGIARIRLTFRPVFGGGTSLERWARKTSFSAGGHKPGQPSYSDWTRRQPTLVISEK